jgi:formylmethanofuran dehydrogenase subunit B
MSKTGKDFVCETCGAPVDYLSMSYLNGALECDNCSLGDPVMSEKQRKRIERRIQKSQLARRNFHGQRAA